MAHFTTSDGVRIYYESHGTGDPLLLAYGIGGNAGMWQPNIHALSARHRLILWEPRGHARSESPADPAKVTFGDRKSTRLNSSHIQKSRMPSSA